MSEAQAPDNEDGLTRTEYARLFIASALSMMMTLVFNGTLYLAYDGIFDWSRDVSTVASITLAIVCLMIARRRPGLIRPRGLTLCTIGLSVAGYALCAAGVAFESAPAIVVGIMAVVPIDLWGIILWLLSLARLPRRQACLCMATSGLAGIALAFAVNEWAPYGLVNLIAAASSVAAVVLCLPLTQGFFKRLPLVEPTSSQQVTQPEAVLPLSHAFYTYIFVFSVAYGFALRCENHAGPLVSTVASLASSGAVALYAWKAKSATKVDSLFVAAFFCVAAGFMFVLTGDARTGQLASTLLMMGYMCLQLLIWLALSAAAQRNTAEAIPTICCGNAASYVGITVGVTLWLIPNDFLAPLLGGDKLVQNVLVITVLAGLVLYTLLAPLVCVRHRNRGHRARRDRPAGGGAIRRQPRRAVRTGRDALLPHLTRGRCHDIARPRQHRHAHPSRARHQLQHGEVPREERLRQAGRPLPAGTDRPSVREESGIGATGR